MNVGIFIVCKICLIKTSTKNAVNSDVMIMSDKHGRDHRANALDENLTIGDKIHLSFERTSEKITWKITKREMEREEKTCFNYLLHG